jgi:hypothetical protein
MLLEDRLAQIVPTLEPGAIAEMKSGHRMRAISPHLDPASAMQVLRQTAQAGLGILWSRPASDI